MALIAMIKTPLTRTTHIAANIILPLLATTTFTGFALLPPPSSRNHLTTPSSFAFSVFHPPASPACVGSKQYTTMYLSATDKDERIGVIGQGAPGRDASNDEAAETAKPKIAPPPKKKSHSVTVCMVPPPSEEYVWQQVNDMRHTLKDPGFYRWPPHANLLYPFLELGSTKEDADERRQKNLQDIVGELQKAVRQCPPFTVKLRQFGTFGGNRRGVLWLDPESFPLQGTGGTTEISPLVQLQARLEEAFSSCQAQSQKSSSGFTPHMTLSHFQNLDDAKAAKELIRIPTEPPLEFVLDRIYLLERIGDDGQFLRVAEIGLGVATATTSPRKAILDSPSPFPTMPTVEDEWVHDERMKLKARRQRSGKRAKGIRRRSRPRQSRAPDTPEVIAAKRVERKAKRERLLEQKADAAFHQSDGDFVL